MTMQLTRRGFLQASAAGAAVLLVGIDSKGALAAGSSDAMLNPFVKIDSDGNLIVLIKHFEMGQGTTTGLTTLVAEELDADWDRVKTEFAPADPEKYKNLFWGVQGTGGSSAIANSYMQHRQSGAAARDLLVRAAASAWGVEPSAIKVEKSHLISGSRRGHFGEFVEQAAKLTPAENVEIKTPDQFTLIGNQDLPRKDGSPKTNGTATFALDVKIPGMVYATILRSPRFGGTLKSFDASGAKGTMGFIDAMALPNNAGVAVFGKNTWAVLKARQAITAEWDFSEAESRSTNEIIDAHRVLLDKPEYDTRGVKQPEAEAAIAGADQVIEAEFMLPYLVHAPMEPLNCVIEPTANGVRFHDGCQIPTIVQGTIAAVLGLEGPQAVEVNTVYAGGSFGRRATPTADYQVEAALAFALLGKQTPVKLIWDRVDDIRGGYYRAIAMHRAKIGLDGQGNLLGWDHRIATKSIMKGTAFEGFAVKDGVDHSSVEGAEDTLYNLPAMSVGLGDFQSPITVLWWRSVGHTHSAYAMEVLLDMVAEAAGKDPVAMRLDLLDKSDDKQRRLAGVIEAARDMSGWKPGDKRGFAAHPSFSSYVAIVADVSADGNKVHVDKLHIAIDCGVAINPDVIIAQMEGGAGYGLGAVMRNKLTLNNGEIQESNFPDYEPLRLTDMPEIEVKIVTSNEAPTGVGEPATPPTGPAVANAIYAKTGIRITSLPMTDSGIQFV